MPLSWLRQAGGVAQAVGGRDGKILVGAAGRTNLTPVHQF